MSGNRFKNIYVLWTGLLLAGTYTGTGHAQDPASGYARTITAGELKDHLTVIASDSMEGRFTGSPGQRKAAGYMASFFREYGLTAPAKTKDGSPSYFQRYNLYRRGWGEVYIKVKNNTYTLNKDLLVNGLTHIPEATEVETVWVGYGIESPRYNDYQGVNVKGKAVVLFEGEPQSPDGSYLVSGTTERSKWSRPQGWEAKASVALEKGAKYVVLISDKDQREFQKDIQRRASMSYRLSPMTLKPVEESLGDLAAFTVNKAIAAEILGTSVKTLNRLKNKITKTSHPLREGPEGRMSLKAERRSEIIETENVAALLEGTDKKDELIVISAHLDHIGISPTNEINNGADDDGSGTVALLELAQAFSKAKAEGHGPRRSLLFLNVTGEELGLFGSQYYSENPLFPLENTIANLNIDMIGRVDEAHKDNPEYVYLIGSDRLSSELHAISEEANKAYVNFKLDYTYNDPNDPNRFYERSDHYNFAKKGIPVIFYFTGVHEDYHRPGDDVEKIMFDKHASIVKLIFHTTWELANREARIKVDRPKL